MIHLHSLGQCMITLTGVRLLPTARLMFASALYVAVEGTRTIARDKMASLIWPDQSEDRGIRALRQTLYRLRGQGMPIDSDASHVVLAAGTVRTDYDELIAPESPCPVEDLLTRIPGGFLPGYMPTVSEPFAEWVEEQRARVNAQLRRRLIAGIGVQRAAGNWPATQALAQRCLELDPLNEEATLAYAEAMAMDGSKALAIMTIDRYMNEIGPRAKEMHLPATMLRKRISELYPLPTVIEKDPPQTGREAEMAKLDAALREARPGRGRAVVVSGPPGIGKTRLVTEFTRAAHLQGVRIVRTSMTRWDARRPLGAWNDLVPQLQRMPGALGCDPESLSFLKRLTSRETPKGEEQDAEYLFARIRMAVLDLVASVASESCVIVWVEDVHWMDEWSWEVMTALTKKLDKSGVLVLLTRRDAEEEGPPTPVEAVVEPLPLGPLDEAGCRRLLALVDVGSKRGDEEFTDWCVRTCAGNPYFLIELGRRASRSDGKFLAPPSLTKLIAQRFGDVAPLSRRVLQSAAVLGRNSTLPRIESVLDERRVSLMDSLDELVRHALVLTDQERVVCRHDLLGISALSEISALTLSLLHRHAAEVLEAEIDEESSPDYLWDCAEHWEAAGERERALALLDRCVERAMAMGTPQPAVRALEGAIGWLPASESREGLERRLVRTLFQLGQFERLLAAHAKLSAGIASRGAHVERHSQEELLALEAEAFSTEMTEKALGHIYACAMDSSAGATHRAEAALLTCKLAQNMYRPVEAATVYSHILGNPGDADKDILAELTVVYETSFGSTALGAATARTLALRHRGPLATAKRARTLRMCSFALSVAGDIGEALECARESADIARTQQLTGQLATSILASVRIHLAMGDHRAASRCMNELEATRDSIESVDKWMALEYAARIPLLAGDVSEALPLMRIALEQRTVLWRRAVVHQAGLRAQVRLFSEDWHPNEEEVSELLDFHREARMWGTHDLFVLVLSQCLEAAGRGQEAVRLYGDYVNKYRRDGAPVLPQLSARIAALAAETRTPRPLDLDEAV